MTLRSLWSQRVQDRHKKLDDLHHVRLARGSMPHWSTYVKRELDSGPTRGSMSHMMRPQHDLTEPHTCCGWAQASFRSASAFNLPRHVLEPCSAYVADFCSRGELITCPHCADVIDDIAAWVELASGRKPEPGAQHMMWSYQNVIQQACGAPMQGTRTMVYREFAAVAALSDHGACELCVAIFGRLFGPTRPENDYLSFTTNEEAQKQRELLRGGMR